jgi:small-conductance mechanosensitive channel
MDITVRKNYGPHDKITKKEIRNYFRVGSYALLFFVFLLTYFFLQDENLRILGSLAYKVVVRKIALGGVFTFLILVLKNLVERLVVKKSIAPAYYNPLRVLRLSSILLIAISVVSTFFVNWYTAVFSLGVISLILSFALQTPLTSLIAWVYILIRSPYRVGDRIKINALKGDVVEVNYFDTTLWELGGDYLSNDVPSGRLIRFPNSMVLQSAVFNYSWEKFPYLWNEVSIFVPYNSDLDHVEKIMKAITAKELGTELNKSIKHFKEAVKETSVDEEGIHEEPYVSFNIHEESWIQATVIYPVELNRSIGIRNRLIKNILAELQKAKV